MTRFGCLALLASLALSTIPADAQMIIRRGGPGGDESGALLDVAPASYGVTGWTVGEWARYNSTQNMGQMSITRFRTLSVLEQAGDKWWVEIVEEATGAIRLFSPVQKVLIPFGAMTERGMSEMFMLSPDSSIRHTTVVRPPQDNPPTAFPRGWQKGGEESITTAAGTFKSTKYSKGDQELWVSAAASPLGVVRFRNPDTTIELVARGATGAKSKFPPASGQ